MNEREDLQAEQKRQIASLTSHPGYHLLLDEMDALVVQILAEMETEKQPHELLAKCRVWQLLSLVTKTLRVVPQNLQQELAEAVSFYSTNDFFGTNVPPEFAALLHRNRVDEGEGDIE